MPGSKELGVKLFVKSTNMSRIGKQIIEIPNGVEVNVSGEVVSVKGSKGTLSQQLPPGLTVKVEDNKAQVLIAENADAHTKIMWGTIASLIKNMVEGLSKGYEKNLEVNGVGFKVALQGSKLNFALGFSHPVVFEIPKGIEVAVEKNKISIKGYDKQLVGQVAAQIRALKKPEPYKGKGIKYVDEVIRRKAGKAAVGAE